MRNPIAAQIISIAMTHVNNGAVMMTSAQLCLSDALKTTDDVSAAKQALRSLAYSVGILSPDYQRATGLVEALKIT